MSVSKLQDERMLDGVPIKERYRRFAVRLVETGNRLHAYRTAFAISKKDTADFIHEAATALANDPEIAAYVQSLRDAAATQLLISVTDLMRDYVDIVQADPNEIVSHVRENCRFCRGEQHRYQWKDYDEFVAECERVERENVGVAVAKQTPLPNADGGVGFDSTLDPIPTCPSCFGQGIGRVHLHDTRKLTPAARKLYLGVKETAGGIEVKMADKDKAREALGKMLGIFKDGVPVIPTAPVKDAKPATKEEAAKSYLKLIQGGKA